MQYPILDSFQLKSCQLATFSIKVEPKILSTQTSPQPSSQMSTMSSRTSSYSTSSSGTSTPALSNSWAVPSSVSHAVTGLLRRFSAEPSITASRGNTPQGSPSFQNSNGVYTPPYRTASPFQPPPLYPVTLHGYQSGTADSAQLLSRQLAEEIRLLVPPRLQLCEEWNLVYSLDQDGVSLGTLYKKCENLRGLRNGFVLVVKDGEGSLFGAYLTEAPHPNPHYFGTGECFLWRASLLSLLNNLPPPPSADTTQISRSTTIASPSVNSMLSPPAPNSSFNSGASTPERIRFKAFPYSGVNDYMMLCDASFLSVGGGDGKYGLWLDSSFERGISSPCLTFGNEGLSEEGEKFEIIGVELWTLGNLASP